MKAAHRTNAQKALDNIVRSMRRDRKKRAAEAIKAARVSKAEIDAAMETVIEKALDERQQVTERDLRAEHFTSDQIKARFAFCVARVLERRPDLRQCITQAA